MADPFSIATGALTVAEVGVKLHKTLKEYIEGVVDADKHFRRIADEVRTTSWALRELGDQLQSEDDDLNIFKPAAKLETKAALDGCRDTFKELEVLLNLSFKVDTVSGVSSTNLSRMSKLKFPGRNKKIKSLLGELERLKTTLLLICHIIPAAKRAAKKDALPVQDRVQLEYLIKAWKDTKDIEKHPLSTVDTTQSGVDSGMPGTTFMTLDQNLGSVSDALSRVPSNRDLVKNDQVTLGLNADNAVTANFRLPGFQDDILPAVHNAAILPPSPLLHAYPSPGKIQFDEARVPEPAKTGTVWNSDSRHHPQYRLPSPLAPSQPRSISADNIVRSATSDRGQEISSQLDACASAVAKLSSAIERVSRSLQGNEHKWDLQGISKSYALTRRAVDGLLAIDQDNLSDDILYFEFKSSSATEARLSTEVAAAAIHLRKARQKDPVFAWRRRQRHSAQHSQVQKGHRKRLFDWIARMSRSQAQHQSPMCKPQILSDTLPQIDDHQSKAQAQVTYDSAAQLPIRRSPQYQYAFPRKVPAYNQDSDTIIDESTQKVIMEMADSHISDKPARESGNSYDDRPHNLTAPLDTSTRPENPIDYCPLFKRNSYEPPRNFFFEHAAVGFEDSEELDSTHDEEAEDGTVAYTDPIIALLREWTTVDV